MSDELIRLDSIYKTYQMGDVTLNALDDVSLTINHGEYMAILGPSGSGKSTLMNILGCLDAPSRGEYWLDRENVGYLKPNALAHIRNHKIGFIFQSFNLLDFSTALENVALPLVYRGMKSSERNKRAAEMLEKVGLGDRLNHKPQELSGGQRQRVAVARALVTDPEVLLADEPTGNLDTKSGDAVVGLFEGLADKGKTVIVVTHDLAMAERTRRIIKIRDGKVEE
jgi:putative ABC transport system ATP-binding protein